MRRPLKPFVTEYKPSTRRTPIVQGEQHGVEEKAGSKLFDLAQTSGADDSYDAAMRAADAFFSIRPEAPPTQPDAQSPVETQTNSFPPEKNVGRILRAIDEEPARDLLALEAERAPKRRGRKPGSKNKPKPQSLGAPQTTKTTSAKTPSHRAEPKTRKIALAAAAASSSVTGTQATPAISSHSAPTNAVPSVSRDVKRFPWVRDRLKPGEDWKRRRLPRICW